MSEEIKTTEKTWLQMLMDYEGYVPEMIDIHRKNFLKAEYSGFKDRVIETMLSEVAAFLDDSTSEGRILSPDEESFITFCVSLALPAMEKVYKVHTFNKTMKVINVLLCLELIANLSEGFKKIRQGQVRVDKVLIRGSAATVSVGSVYTYHVGHKSAKAFVTNP